MSSAYQTVTVSKQDARAAGGCNGCGASGAAHVSGNRRCIRYVYVLTGYSGSEFRLCMRCLRDATSQALFQPGKATRRKEGSHD